MKENDGRIRQYMIEELRMPLEHVENTLDRLKTQPSVYDEFCDWLSSRKFPETGIELYGYSADKIAKIQPALSALAVYLLLVDLRNHCENTLRYLGEGLPIC